MPFWVTFLFWLGSSIVSALLAKPKRENVRPSGLDEFQVPTATEGRVVPIVIGKAKVSGPNVVWYGDLRADPITEKVGGFLGIGAKKVTKGYRYKLGVQMATCRGPIDGHDRIWFGDKVIKSGESAGNVAVTDEGFFGGEDRGGGIAFTLGFFAGTTGQAVAPYLAAFQNPLPRYQNTSYFLLYDGASGPGYIGNAAQLRQLAFELYWYPNSLAVTGGKERIGDDANPICFLYELLVTNTDWGVGFPGSDVLVTGTAATGALRAIAEQVADEGLGFSGVIDRELEVRELIQEIERHVDGAFRLDLADGRYKIVLARPPASTPVTLDEGNIVELVSFSRGNWDQTANELRIGFTDRAKEYQSTFAFDYDLANREITGRRSIQTLSFGYVKDAVTAQKIAARELPGFSLPQMRMSAKVDRQLYRLQRGDPFLWTWPDEGVTDLPMRVTRVGYGTDRSAEITLDGVEDIYRLETTGFVSPPATGWTAPITAAVAALDARIWEPPRQLAPAIYQPILLVARNGGLQLAYDVYTDIDGGTTEFELTNAEVQTWTPVAELAGAVLKDLNGPPHYTDTITIDGLRDITVADLALVAAADVSSSAPLNVFLVDDELIFWTAAVDNLDGTYDLTVQRGAFGTIPASHADNARVWFPTWGAAAVFETPSSFTFGPIRCRVVTKTITGELALGSAPNIPVAADYAILGDRPYAVGDPQVGVHRFVDADWTKTPGFLRMTWNPRNRSSQAFGTTQLTTGIAHIGSAGVQVEVRRVDTDAIVAQTTFANNGAFNAIGFLPQTTPGTPDELDYYIELRTGQQGKLSQEWATQAFEVFGFGIDFGGDFGGQDTGGPNLGVVLGQADPPEIIDPVPQLPGIARRVEIEFLGTPASGEFVRLVIDVWDTIAGEFVTVDQTLTFAGTPTAEGMAAALTASLVSALADRPFNITRSGTLIVILTEYGDASLRFARSIQDGLGVARPSIVQEPIGSQPGKRGGAYVDFWTEEFQAGDVIEVLAPETSASYANLGSHIVAFQLYGLTWAKRKELEAINVGRITVLAQATSSTGRLSDLQAAVNAINNHPLGEFVNALLGTLTDVGSTQLRSALVLQPVQDVGVFETYYETHDFGDPTGFKLLTKISIAPIVAGPLPQVTIFRPGVTSLPTGSVVGLQLGANYYTGTVGSPGGSDQVNTAWGVAVAALAAANPTYTATLTPGPNIAQIEITGPNNTAFTAFAWHGVSGSTLRVRFTRTED